MDSMALILHLEHRKLPQKIKDIFQKAEKAKVSILIPTMVLAEIGYLFEKGRIETSLQHIKQYCENNKTFIVEPITEEIIHKCFEISDIAELHDRIIAATAYAKKLTLITNDPIIAKSIYVSTVW